MDFSYEYDREQKAESRKQKAESRKQKIVATVDLTIKHPGVKIIANCITARENRGISNITHWKWCCYVNYKRIDKINIKIAKALLARDYKGFSSGFEFSNGVNEIYEE